MSPKSQLQIDVIVSSGPSALSEMIRIFSLEFSGRELGPFGDQSIRTGKDIKSISFSAVKSHWYIKNRKSIFIIF